MTPAGPLLGGRYELGAVIGRGGMAEVHCGSDVRLGRPVAVKVLREDLARDPAFQARFRREAQAAASLDAAAVVAVYDTGEDERGVPWIVMELVDGRTLREVLHSEGRLLPQRALEVSADVCSALEAAHAAGMVHRDIKPANVMLTARGEVKVMDFGIARAAAASSAAMTQTAAVIGTAAYLSPEQARGEHVDGRSDLYSTGCLLYELVTGVPPFVGDSALAVAYQHVREDPVPPTNYDPSLSSDVDALVLKAMAKNPANRYQSAQEMRADLLRAVAGQPVLATPVLPDAEPAEPVRSTGKSRRRLAYIAFILCLLALAVAAGLLVHALLSSDPPRIRPPVVVGLAQATATQQLAASGLRVGAVRAVFHPEPVGTVLAQSPDQHFFIHRGDAVDLTISRGVERTTVPAVIGLGEQQAEAELGAARLKVTTVPRNSTTPLGTILDAQPRPRSPLSVQSAVTLVVSTGVVPVPDVRGRSQAVSIALLQKAGFSVGVRQVASRRRAGTVVFEDLAGTLAPAGSTVIVDVAGSGG